MNEIKEVIKWDKLYWALRLGTAILKSFKIRKRNELVLTNYIEPTPKGAVRDGFIMDMDAVFDSLKSH